MRDKTSQPVTWILQVEMSADSLFILRRTQEVYKIRVLINIVLSGCLIINVSRDR